MRWHDHYSEVTIDHEQLLKASVDNWNSYANHVIPLLNIDTSKIEWSCYNCGRKVMIKYFSSNVKDVYCENCKPKKLFSRSLNAFQIRHFNQFKRKIISLIKNNTGI